MKIKRESTVKTRPLWLSLLSAHLWC